MKYLRSRNVHAMGTRIQTRNPRMIFARFNRGGSEGIRKPRQKTSRPAQSSKEFRRKLDLFVLAKVKYAVTAKGKAEEGEAEIRRRFDAGELEQLYDRGQITRSTYPIWTEAGARMEVVRMLVTTLKLDPRELDSIAFVDNGLAGMLCRQYGGSPHEALVEAGYAYSESEAIAHAHAKAFGTEKIYPWEMKRSLVGFKLMRVAATSWLLWKTGKKPGQINRKDFEHHGLFGLLSHHNTSPYLALVEAGYAYSINELLAHGKLGRFGTEKIYPWEMAQTYRGAFKQQAVRKTALDWLLWKTRKNPGRLRRHDFTKHGLRSLLQASPFKALVDAGYAFSITEAKRHAQRAEFKSSKLYPWQTTTPDYRDGGVRIAAVKWLLWRIKKRPDEVTKRDFRSCGLYGLLKGHYSGSTYRALCDIGRAHSLKETLQHARIGRFNSKKLYPWELKTAPQGFYNIRAHRLAARAWLAWKTGKKPSKLSTYDYKKHGLSGIVRKYSKELVA